MKINPIFLIIVFLGVLSCSQSNKQEALLKNENPGNFKVAIELILENEADKDSLMAYFSPSEKMEVYQWKNHIVLWGMPKDTIGLSQLVKNAPVNLEIKKYDQPFYVFDRETGCNQGEKAKRWKNYLLTANLVKDPSLQQEYMDYHKHQFQDWPEVGQGFCNASFQKLLLFRNGRQLMLVISIPSDKTLDELNPKTTENNPRVEEWNKIMAKYQEGIEGTDKGEVWVFLEALVD